MTRAVIGAGHTIHSHQSHLGWDNSIPSLFTVAPGSVVATKAIDASNGQISPASKVDDLCKIDFARINPLCGPICIDGAMPGDAIKVTVLGLKASGWGWTAIFPGRGLLPDQFPEASLQLWKYDASGRVPAAYGPDCRVPLKPFPGTMGLAPAEPGPHPVRPPRRVGGNMDTRDLAEGAVLYLPVEVAGALFSVGDTHAAQGDGEVCGTALESPCEVTLKFDLVKDARLAFPRFDTPGPVTRHLDAAGYHATMGVGPDLMEAARAAVSGMIDLLGKLHGLSADKAYILCSVCADLRISEIVDRPNWIVSLYFPRIVFA